jgi:hypothetical protein
VCSVRGLHRAFPPPDPPVYVWPQLKPSHGICCFTTTIFGAHRGADQGAGRSTSGQDLLHLLGGSTSASPMSTAGLLQLPELTSTRPGRYSVVPDLHWHFRAGIFFPGPSLAFPGPALVGPGRHISVSAGICLFLAGIRFFLASIRVCGPGWAVLRSLPAGMWATWADPSHAPVLSAPGPCLGFHRSWPLPGLLIIPPAFRPLPRLGRVAASFAPGPHPDRPHLGSVRS